MVDVQQLPNFLLVIIGGPFLVDRGPRSGSKPGARIPPPFAEDGSPKSAVVGIRGGALDGSVASMSVAVESGEDVVDLLRLMLKVIVASKDVRSFRGERVCGGKLIILYETDENVGFPHTIYILNCFSNV